MLYLSVNIDLFTCNIQQTRTPRVEILKSAKIVWNACRLKAATGAFRNPRITEQCSFVIPLFSTYDVLM